MGVADAEVLASRFALAWATIGASQIAEGSGAGAAHVAETVGSKQQIRRPKLVVHTNVERVLIVDALLRSDVVVLEIVRLGWICVCRQGIQVDGVRPHGIDQRRPVWFSGLVQAVVRDGTAGVRIDQLDPLLDEKLAKVSGPLRN